MTELQGAGVHVHLFSISRPSSYSAWHTGMLVYGGVGEGMDRSFGSHY